MTGPSGSVPEVRYVRDEAPDPVALADLREAVGYERAASDHARACTRYSVMVAAHEESGALVGWCSAVDDGVRHAFVVDLIVHPLCQRRGIGSELLRRVVAAELDTGVSIVHADFAPSNAAFYEHNGFTLGVAGIYWGSDAR